MKSIYILFILFTSCMSIKNNKNQFYNKITNDFRDNSYFILVRLESDRKYIVENDDLFIYYSTTKKFTKEMYIEFIRTKLINNTSLEIDNLDSTFIKVRKNSNVEINAKKGIKNFIKTYFDNGKTLKDGIKEGERIAIIQQLFKWKIGSMIDDETGYLVISR